MESAAQELQHACSFPLESLIVGAAVLTLYNYSLLVVEQLTVPIGEGIQGRKRE